MIPINVMHKEDNVWTLFWKAKSAGQIHGDYISLTDDGYAFARHSHAAALRERFKAFKSEHPDAEAYVSEGADQVI